MCVTILYNWHITIVDTVKRIRYCFNSKIVLIIYFYECFRLMALKWVVYEAGDNCDE